MNDTGTVDSVPENATRVDTGGLLRLFRFYQRWKRRNVFHHSPTGSIRLAVAERLHERELFLEEVRGQLLDLEESIDELTETIHSMRGNEK